MNNITTAGIINQPFYENTNQLSSSLGRYLWGIVGLGVFDSIKGKIKNPTIGLDPNRKKKIITAQYSQTLELLKRDLKKIQNGELIHAGGAGYKVLCVIDGQADCYVYTRNGTIRWDTCAPEALLRSLNGQLTDVFGNNYCYANNNPKDLTTIENQYGIVATCETTSYYCSFLSDELKEQVINDKF